MCCQQHSEARRRLRHRVSVLACALTLLLGQLFIPAHAGPSNVRNGAGDGSSVSDRLSKLQSPRLPRASQRSDEQPVRIDRSPQTAAVRRDWWSQQASGPGRVLVDGTSVAASGQTTVTMYWWNNADSSYVQASGLCASYGGTLAVLSAGPSGPSGLTQGVEYWIGLFNAAQMPWTWTWIDQTAYDNKTAQWDTQQPAAGLNAGGYCVYLAWSESAADWRWLAGDCDKPRAVLCQLPASGSVPAAQSPFSCAAAMSLSAAPAYQTIPLTDPDFSQHPQLCAALCRKDDSCHAFRVVTGGVCELQARPAAAIALPAAGETAPPLAAFNVSVRLSCLRFGLDFVALGSAIATRTLGDAADVGSSGGTYKCLPEYRVNMVLARTVLGVCDPAACASLCGAAAWAGNTTCSVFVHSRSRCRCQLGYNSLYGLDLATDVQPGAGYVACMKSDADWLRFGAVNDPSTVTTTLGDKVLTLHPERLSYDAAAAVCRSQSPTGTLVSLTSLPEILLVATRLLLSQPPRLVTPLTTIAPAMYGVWLGLAAPSAQLAALVDRAVGATTLGMTWDDGLNVNRTLIELLWAVLPNGTATFKPDPSAARTCVYMSNTTTLKRPGLAAAGACSWELPFICEATIASPSPRPLPALSPPMSTAAAGSPGAAASGPAVVVAVSSDVAAALPAVAGGSTIQPQTTAPTSLNGQPTIITVPDTGVMMWLQPNLDPDVPRSEANGWCSIWNASLATVYNRTASAALTSAADPLSPPYWINLFVNKTSLQWEWGAPNTRKNSSDYMAQYTGWCAPEGQTLITGSNRQPPPPVTAGPECAALSFAPGRCPDNGWGWMPRNCSEPSSYMCMASPRGTPGYYYCADHYDLAGTVTRVNDFGGGVTSAQAASYCSDLCTSEGSCHAFTVVNSTCIRKSRNASSLFQDVVRANVTVGCFKYGVLWDMLGGVVAVQTKVAADASSRFRCIRFQDVTRTNLQVLPIRSCLISDCTAMCFATRSCQVAIFDHTTCQCTLGRDALVGIQGTNEFRDGITTCIYDDVPTFLGIGLTRSAVYIKPPASGAPPAAGGDYLGGSGGGISQDSGSVDDINFVPSGNTPGSSPPSTNPSNPNAQSPAPAPSPNPSPATPTPVPVPSPAGPVPSPSLLPSGGGGGGSLTPAPSPTDAGGVPSGSALPPPPSTNSAGGGVDGGGAAQQPPSLLPNNGAQAPVPTPSPPSSSRFGTPEMIGITVGFCCTVLIVFILAAFIMRRRRDAAAAALANAGKDGLAKAPTGGAPGAGGADGSGAAWLARVDSRKIASALRTAGLSADTERAVMTFVETSVATTTASAAAGGSQHTATAPSGRLPSGRPASLPTITQAQALELQSALRRESSASLDKDTLQTLEQLLVTVQEQANNTGQHQSDRQSAGDAALSAQTSGSTIGPLIEHPGAAAAAAAAALASKSGVCSSYITLSRLLGAGSFGTVYEGVWRKQTVAVKIIPHSPSAAERVRNEVELAMQFDHPNVVRSFFYETFDAHAMSNIAQMEVKTVARESQETWIVIEFCSEGSLASRLYASDAHAAHGAGAGGAGGAADVPVPRPMSERDPCLASMDGILRIAMGVAQGMAYMHSLSICHGDLKCENVLLSSPFGGGGAPPGQVTAKVGDFGLSRAIGDVSSHLSTATVGTVTHMPPELLLSGRLRPSCDVYSFGIMLWQLYTGAVPYAGMRYAEIVYKVAVCNLRPLFPTDCPKRYRDLAQACWNSDATARPTFEQVIAELSEMRDDVSSLEAERESCQASFSTPPSIEIPTQAADDITLMSPWIHACPTTSNGLFGSVGPAVGPAAVGGVGALGLGGGLITEPSNGAQLATWAADILANQPAAAAGAVAGPTPAATTGAAGTPASTLSPALTARGEVVVVPGAPRESSQQHVPSRLSLSSQSNTAAAAAAILAQSGSLPITIPSARLMPHSLGSSPPRVPISAREESHAATRALPPPPPAAMSCDGTPRSVSYYGASPRPSSLQLPHAASSPPSALPLISPVGAVQFVSPRGSAAIQPGTPDAVAGNVQQHPFSSGSTSGWGRGTPGSGTTSFLPRSASVQGAGSSVGNSTSGSPSAVVTFHTPREGPMASAAVLSNVSTPRGTPPRQPETFPLTHMALRAQHNSHAVVGQHGLSIGSPRGALLSRGSVTSSTNAEVTSSHTIWPPSSSDLSRPESDV